MLSDWACTGEWVAACAMQRGAREHATLRATTPAKVMRLVSFIARPHSTARCTTLVTLADATPSLSALAAAVAVADPLHDAKVGSDVIAQ